MYIEDNDEHAELASAALSQINLSPKMIRLVDAESGLDYLFGELQVRNRVDYPLPDIILLDLSLPGISGFDFLKKIKENELTKNIPIVILTTSGHDKDIDLAYNMGANSYIVKPEDTVEFIIKLNEINSYWSITSEIPKIATPI